MDWRMPAKRKKYLYREFIKYRTKDKGIKYKKYKNKLVDIIRKCKKEYYNKELTKNRNNIKETWKLLNNLIRNDTKKANYVNYFIENGNNITNMNEVVDGL